MSRMRTIILAASCVSASLACIASEIQAGPQSPFAIPTFHCLGLYWSPPGGAAEREVLVRYRPQGRTDWKEGLPMRYNPIQNTDEDLTDYRGSIVHLAPATVFEVRLTLAGTSTTTNLTATTWSEARARSTGDTPQQSAIATERAVRSRAPPRLSRRHSDHPRQRPGAWVLARRRIGHDRIHIR